MEGAAVTLAVTSHEKGLMPVYLRFAHLPFRATVCPVRSLEGPWVGL